MNKKEFLKRLEENKVFTDPKEQLDYVIPCIQYYLDNLIDVQILTDKGSTSLRGIQLIKREEDFKLINQAFQSLVVRLDEFKTN